MHFKNLAVLTAVLGVSTAAPKPDGKDTYDYVIVGGGVTGLIVANRLTEKKNNRVLVIESGAAYDNPNIRLPYATTYPLNVTLLWQNYTSDPEPYLGNKTFNTRVAQVLGGGSIVNGMVYDRGSEADYNAWEKLGNKGWGWDGMFPFLKKGVEFIPPPKESVEKYGITYDTNA
jgi:choline dehydrogenase-like flavoprotein